MHTNDEDAEVPVETSLANTTENKDIVFTVNDGGTTSEALRINGTTGRIENLRVGNLDVEGTTTTINTTTLFLPNEVSTFHG